MQKDYLEKAFDVMSRQKEFYKSSKFWEEACKKISKNIIESDLKDFRRDSDNLSFFVPTYGYPGNGFSKEAIKEILNLFSEHKSLKNLLAQKHFLNGETHFFSDYRVLKAANKKEDILDISQFCESSFGNPIEHFQVEGKLYSRSSMNYLLGISYLKSLLPNFIPESVLEIGGGFGTLGEILYQIPDHKIKYIDIDLPPIFLIAFKYLKNACNLKKEDYFLSNLNDKQEVINISDLPSFSFFPTWEIEKLRGKIDLFVNFISFQEMEPFIVKNYLKIISSIKTQYVLLRNLREGKQKATKDSVGVISPVLTEDYSKFLSEYDLIGSNIYPFGYKTVDGFNSELLVFKRKN